MDAPTSQAASDAPTTSVEVTAIGITMQDAAEGSAFTLKMISSRGTQVWPSVGGQTFLVDHFRARFMFKEPPKGDGVAEISDLLTRVGRQHRWMHIEKLQRFDGADAFTKSGGGRSRELRLPGFKLTRSPAVRYDSPGGWSRFLQPQWSFPSSGFVLFVACP
jgi:hypothetical protein